MKPIVQKYFLFISIIFVIIGGINSGIIGIFNINLINLLSKLFGLILVKTIIYVLIGLSSIYLIFKRDVFLSLISINTNNFKYNKLKEKISINANKSIDIEAPPYSKVVYWTNQSENEDLNKEDPWLKFIYFNNTGIAITNNLGIATLKIENFSKEDNVSSKLLYYKYCVLPNKVSKTFSVKI